MTDAAQIAASLSKAQRRALARFPEASDYIRFKLEELGLASYSFAGGYGRTRIWRLTPLGEQVHAILRAHASQEPTDGE